ncbi:MAG: formate--tetrahydrofolate ligase, partial [Lachnospiraceae bacterium]|nr:formate--tetrahydrofolate ligase [Lachnospiraceae bacterium]
MGFQTDIEIAQETQMLPITEIARTAGIGEEYDEQYGRYTAKIDPKILGTSGRKSGKLILVMAINPTPAGEGKTTTTIGLTDALARSGKNVIAALREPSLGPVFGVKGGATGGGYAQVVPMEDINLHFTGDFHAIGAANNLLCAMLDNHIHQGNALGIDPRNITIRRCVDMNDRQLRNVVDGLGVRADGFARQDGFDITVASEVMAVFCLASDISDLKVRLGRMIVGYTYDKKPVTAADLKAQGAMAALLAQALKPNLVQTLEHTPVFIHGGPFANIAHGCNSVIATKMAMKLADYTVTEAGFGADLGAEKFLDIKCRVAGLKPDCVVVVATARALKYNGGVKKTETDRENREALKAGLGNLLKHVSNITKVYKLPCVVAVNRFPTDTEAELELIGEACRGLGVESVVSEVWGRGGEGGLELADRVIKLCERDNSEFSYSYELDAPIADKINSIVTKIYGGAKTVFTSAAANRMKRLEELGFGGSPVCMAKTQYSLT